jgi:hypothetical protein
MFWAAALPDAPEELGVLDDPHAAATRPTNAATATGRTLFASLISSVLRVCCAATSAPCSTPLAVMFRLLTDRGQHHRPRPRGSRCFLAAAAASISARRW